MTVGERLRVFRATHQLTQEGLADKLGFSQSKLSRLESGQRAPDWVDVLQIAHVLDISLDELRDMHQKNRPKLPKTELDRRQAIVRKRIDRPKG